MLRQEQAASFLVEIGVENIDEEKIAQAYADNVGKPFTYTIDKKQHVVPGSETGADGAFNAINLGQLVDAVEPSYQRYDFYHSEPTLVADHHEPVAVA